MSTEHTEASGSTEGQHAVGSQVERPVRPRAPHVDAVMKHVYRAIGAGKQWTHEHIAAVEAEIWRVLDEERDRSAWASKVDCTSKFIGALMDWAPPGTVRMVKDNHGNRYEIEVRKLPPEQA